MNSVQTFIFHLVATPLMGQIVLSEVMFDLPGPDSPNEFVEIFNLSDQTVDLAGWQIRDKTSTDELTDTGNGTVLNGRSYAVILEGDYESDNGLYDNLIPDSVIVLKVDDKSIGNQLSTSDSLFIINSSGTALDSVAWTDISASGFSLERLFLERESTVSNWATSFDSLGTPGLPNSVTPTAVDLGIAAESITHTPLYPEAGEIVSISVTVFGNGTETAEGILKAVLNGMELASLNTPSLAYRDTTLVSLEIGSFPSGIHQIQLTITAEGDDNTFNDTALHEIRSPFSVGVLMLNEILYSPDEGFPEFVEIVNVSSETVDVSQWAISDADRSKKNDLSPIELWPEEYLVIAADSTITVSTSGKFVVPEARFPSLNNSGDILYLFDMTGKIIDSLSFTSDWGGFDGRSLEKLNPSFPSQLKEQWGTCVAPEKMTPGGINSIYLESLPTSSTFSLSPNPFSPDSDGSDDLLYISYNLPFSQAAVTVHIFDTVGRTIRILAKNQASGSEGIMTWDGTSDSGEKARIGIYIVKFSVVELGSRRQAEWVETVVLAERLR